jgi:hypothetical protein
VNVVNTNPLHSSDSMLSCRYPLLVINTIALEVNRILWILTCVPQKWIFSLLSEILRPKISEDHTGLRQGHIRAFTYSKVLWHACLV